MSCETRDPKVRSRFWFMIEVLVSMFLLMEEGTVES